MDVQVAAVAQRDDEGPGRPPPAGLGTRDQSQPAEVDLRQLARLTVGLAHGDAPTVTEAAVLDREPVQRAVGHLHVPAPQQLMHLGEPQPPLLRWTGLQPLLDLVPVPKQPCLGLSRAPLRRRPVPGVDLGGELFARLFRPKFPAQLDGRPDVATDRHTTVACRSRHRRLALAPADSPEHFEDLPHGYLPIRHLAHLPGWGSVRRRCVRGRLEGVDQAGENTSRRVDQARENTRPQADHPRENITRTGGSCW